MRELYRLLFPSLLMFGLFFGPPLWAQDSVEETDATEFSEDILAEEFDEQGESDKQQSCWRYDGYPRYCQSTRGCSYNYRTDRCRQAPVNNRCSYYDNRPYQCNQVQGCNYNRNNNRCVAGGGGGGGGRDWVCSARDSGWEEHWGGHSGYGNTRNRAMRNALNNCQREHGNCRVTSCRQQ